VDLPEKLVALLYQASPAYLATVMPDGSPQLTQVWVDTDGEHVLVNTAQGFRKLRNIDRDPRVAVTVSDPDRPSRYYQVRGHVVDITTEGASEHVEKLSQKYLGRPYPWYSGRDQVRVLLTIVADRITSMG
jgi:PPOX class probable F420-dependent enzyme